MARMVGGPFGLVSGKLGNRVYYVLKGKQVVRMIGKSAKPPTLRQLTSRQCVQVLNAFLNEVLLFVNAGFAPEADARDIYPQNAAFGYNRPVAMKGIYPDVQIDFSLVLLSKGVLDGLKDATVLLAGNAEEGFALHCNWAPRPADLDWPRCNDRLMMLAYFPDAVDAFGSSCPQATFELSGAKRSAGQDTLALPNLPVGERIAVFVAMISEDRKQVSNSQYFQVVFA